MDAETKDALLASIAKWRRNAEAETPGDVLLEATDCPLCMQVVTIEGISGKRNDDHKCKGCPVRERVSREWCIGTPYLAAQEAAFRWRDGGGSPEAFHIAAKAEADFLESLLPVEATP